MKRDRPRKPARVSGKWLALALAIIVHAAFIAVLVFSVRWQNRMPEPVTAELYAPPAIAPVIEQPAPEPEPKPEPGPEPVPAPKPEPIPVPAKAMPKAEPKVEMPDRRAAEIALKAKQEAEKKKEREKKDAEKREREKQQIAKHETEKKAQEAKRLAAIHERQAREAEALRAQAEREQKAQAEAAARAAAQAETAARARAEADYIRRIQAKVKGNVILPPDLAGNPEAIFDVVQLPTGDILDAVLKKSSGVRAYDDAVQRAIVKSSPLPRPERPELFQRTITLKFRPQD